MNFSLRLSRTVLYYLLNIHEDMRLSINEMMQYGGIPGVSVTLSGKSIYQPSVICLLLECFAVRKVFVTAGRFLGNYK